MTGPLRAGIHPRRVASAAALSAILVGILAGSPGLPAQEARVYLPDRIGTWRGFYDSPQGEPAADAAELRALRATLARIEEILRATPMLDPPRGFDVASWQRLDLGCPFEPSACGRTVLGGWITFAFEDYGIEDGKVVTARVEPPHVDIAFNDPLPTHLMHQVGSPGLFDAAGDEIFGKVVELHRVGAFTVYDNGVVIIARPDRPVFVPATREEYLRATIAAFADGAGAEIVTGPLQAELAALTSAQRQSQAYTHVDSDAISRLVPETYEAATPLFKFNRDYFDRSLPRTAVQLITVRFWNFENSWPRIASDPGLVEAGIPLTPQRLAALAGVGVPVGEYRIYELRTLLSYSALAALLFVQ